MDARRRGRGRCSTPPPIEKKYIGGFFHLMETFSLCRVLFPCVENVLGFSPLTKNSEGAHAFAARVDPNNNVALAEFKRNC